MPAILTACAIAVLASALTPQGGPGRGGSLRTFVPRYPPDLGLYQFSPFLDASGKALRVAPQSAGAADFDGDGNIDLWFLGQGGKPGQIAVQFANTAGLGRFYARDPLLTSNYVSAATYRTAGSSVDQLIVVDPAADEPGLLHWNPRQTHGDPRDGYLGGAASGWKIGKAMTEIQTADHARDGHDDIVALQALPGNQTAVHKLVMGTSKYNFLWVEARVFAILPAQFEKLRLLDIDGDRRTDFVAYAPGHGVLACVDNAMGGFTPVAWWGLGNTVIEDIAVGDVDRNGRDDIAVCFSAGIALIESYGLSSQHPTGFEYRIYMNPTSVGALATCCILDIDTQGRTAVFGLPTDGRNYVLHPHNPALFGLVGPWVEPAPAGLSGQGLLGQSLIVTDVDNDHDADLVLQSPTGTEWQTLRNPAISMAPTSITSVDKGPAPVGEGSQSRRLDVTVGVPQALIDEGVLFVEMAFFVPDPSSKNLSDPDYLYWGRLAPAINTLTKTASFTVFYDENVYTWAQRILTYKKHRDLGLSTFADVYPEKEWETLRAGLGAFLSMHGLDAAKRYESSNGDPPPIGTGSTLGGKWVLAAGPPSPKGDVDLLPWE